MFSNDSTTSDWQPVIDLTAELIKIESVTPSGKERILAYAAEYLGAVEKEIVRPDNAGPYLIARIGEKKRASFTLILEGHLDTVPPGEMADPFAPFINQDRLFGRGACDMKSGCAAMMFAFSRYAISRQIKGEVILVLVTDEESASACIADALKRKLPRANLALVAEPTDLTLGVAHKGIEWREIEFYGKAGHASTPENGVNAILMASRFIQTMEEFTNENFPGRRHPVCGLPTLTVGFIRGGQAFPNIIPDACTIRLDRRWNPNETIDAVWQEIDLCNDRCKQKYPDFRSSWKRIGATPSQLYPPLDFPVESPLYSKISQILNRSLNQTVKRRGLSFWTEGALFQEQGTPALIFGPGSIDQAHTAQEFVLLEQIVSAARGYFSVMLGIEGLE